MPRMYYEDETGYQVHKPKVSLIIKNFCKGLLLGMLLGLLPLVIWIAITI